MKNYVEVTGWREACEQAAVLVQDSPAAPMAADLVVVPAAGHRRWFTQYLATRTGGPRISAGIDVETWRVFSQRFRSDAWQGESLTLAICDVLADPAQADVLAPVLHHLATPQLSPGRRYAAASRLARLFRRYLWRTPDMVASWSAGSDRSPSGGDLASEERWQPALWRAVVRLLGSDPAEQHDRTLRQLEQQADPQIPQRVVLLLVDDPDPALNRLIDALGCRHEVQVIQVAGIACHHDSPGSDFLRHHNSRRDAGRESLDRPQQRSETGLASGCQTETDDGRPDPVSSAFAAFRQPKPPTLLRQVQDELRRDLPPGPRAEADDSLQIHACHGPDRQVEVLRDVLCGLFSDDPSLQPRDVVVLCTDLAEYAPLIEASFCLDPGAGFHPGHRLRVQLASAGLASVNPALAVLSRLLALYVGRATSIDLLDFCQLPAISHRFGFGPDEIERLRELIANAQIRWGVDAAQRSRNGVAITQSTWLAGVQRLSISLALAAEPPVALGTCAPVGQVQGSDAQLIGRLAELVSRVRKVIGRFGSEATAETWAGHLREAIDLLVSLPFEDSWQLNQALSAIADFAQRAAGRTAPLDATDISCWLDGLDRSAGRRPNYGNGSLLVTDLNDLAGIGARVICVLGLDDAHFPGPAGFDGDDLLRTDGSQARQHWTWRRRAVRRQRLLDALLGATDHFVVVTQGAEQSSGRVRPAPVCISELLDACAVQGPAGAWRVDGLANTGAGSSDGEAGYHGTLVRWHPLHPHGWQDFAVSGNERVASFDQQGLQGARALQSPPKAPPPTWTLQHRCTPSPQTDIEDLIRFFCNPARALLKETVGTTRTRFDHELKTSLPISPDAREAWSVGRELFDALAAGHGLAQVRNHVWLSGQVLPGPAGAQLLDDQLDRACQVASSVRSAKTGERTLRDCRIDYADGKLQGRVPLVDDKVVVQRFGFPKPDDALACWLRLLLVVAQSDADQPGTEGLLVGKRCYRLSAPSGEQAREILGWLVTTRREGLRHVLPLPLRTAAAYADLLNWTWGEPMVRARQAYRDEDANWQYFFPDFDDLTQAWPGRFEKLADRLLAPLADHLTEWRPASRLGDQ